MNLRQIDVTGCRLEGAITKKLGLAGPKHHAVIIGKNESDGRVYIAESMKEGYQLSTVDDFKQRYAKNGEIIISANDGPFEDINVANRALQELNKGGKGDYCLLTNNCESFVNRAIHDNSSSDQIINTAIGILAFIGVAYVLKASKN